MTFLKYSNNSSIIAHVFFLFRNRDGLLPYNGLDYLLLNLTLCDIMVSLANPSTLQEDSDWLAMIRTFVTEKLISGWKLNAKQLKRLLEVTNRLLHIHINRGEIFYLCANASPFLIQFLFLNNRAKLFNNRCQLHAVTTFCIKRNCYDFQIV